MQSQSWQVNFHNRIKLQVNDSPKHQASRKRNTSGNRNGFLNVELKFMLCVDPKQLQSSFIRIRKKNNYTLFIQVV